MRDQFPQDRLDTAVIYPSLWGYTDYGDFPQFAQFLEIPQLKGQIEVVH